MTTTARKFENGQLIMRLKLLLFVFTMLMTMASTVTAKSVTAVALFNDRAMLSVDGQKAKIIRAGAVLNGVKLISSNTDEAVVEIDGQRETLTLNSTTELSHGLGAVSQTQSGQSIELQVNANGFFESFGQVNGRNIRFLVDTGANLVVLNSVDAQRVGIDYLDGIKTFAATASGTAPMYEVELDSITLGGIRVEQVKAGVIEGQFPVTPLLGMTFLRELNMTRNGNTMTLETR